MCNYCCCGQSILFCVMHVTPIPVTQMHVNHFPRTQMLNIFHFFWFLPISMYVRTCTNYVLQLLQGAGLRSVQSHIWALQSLCTWLSYIGLWSFNQHSMANNYNWIIGWDSSCSSSIVCNHMKDIALWNVRHARYMYYNNRNLKWLYMHIRI